MQIVKKQDRQADFGPEDIRLFFIEHLNRIYCAKAHLVERLPEIRDNAEFEDLKYAIDETLDDVENQIARMDEIYSILNAEKAIQDFNGVIGLVEDAFTSIYHYRDNPSLRDMGILFYLQNIESLEMASFKVLMIVAAKFNDDKIKQLLKDNYNEAMADRALLILILTRYVIK